MILLYHSMIIVRGLTSDHKTSPIENLSITICTHVYTYILTYTMCESETQINYPHVKYKVPDRVIFQFFPKKNKLCLKCILSHFIPCFLNLFEFFCLKFSTLSSVGGGRGSDPSVEFSTLFDRFPYLLNKS